MKTSGYYLTSGSKLLNGKYTIQEKLGSGGFGITYKGIYQKEVDIQERFSSVKTMARIPVAIKELFIEGKCVRGSDNSTLHLQSLRQEEFSYFKSRFLQEAETLSRFRDIEEVVHVIDYFEENDTAYMVMAYVEGETLQQLVKRVGKLTEERAIDYIVQLCRGMSQVHLQNVLHRDIKPANIIINSKNRAVLIDFGAAREFASNEGVTMSIMLTQGYAPIEQYSQKRPQGPYTDIHALGATLYFCVTGKNPESVYDRERGKPVYLPDCSQLINSSVAKAMSFEPKDRFQDCDGLLLSLDASEVKTKYKDPEVKVNYKKNTYDWYTGNREYDGARPTESFEKFKEKKEAKTKPKSKRKNFFYGFKRSRYIAWILDSFYALGCSLVLFLAGFFFDYFKIYIEPKYLLYCLPVIIFVVYFVIPEFKFGCTLGQKAEGLKVVGYNYQNITIKQALIRNIGKILTPNIISFFIYTSLWIYYERTTSFMVVYGLVVFVYSLVLMFSSSSPHNRWAKVRIVQPRGRNRSKKPIKFPFRSFFYNNGIMIIIVISFIAFILVLLFTKSPN